MGIPEQPTIPKMPAPKPAPKEAKESDLKLIIKELHNISQELKTLNKRIYNR